jgi:hypothetical protein
MIGDSKVFGHVYTPPEGGYTLGNNGTVGDQAFQSDPANAGKVQSGFYASDLNQSISDAVPPAGWSLFTTLTSNPQTINGVAYDYVLSSGNYQLASGQTLQGKILVQGDATLYVPLDGRIQFGNGEFISLDPSLNATFKIYNASTMDVVMQDVSNDSGIASRFTYYGLPTTTGSKMTVARFGDYPFIGVLYAPNQNLVLSASKLRNQDIIGAITANDVKMNGDISMHVDEALFKNGIGSMRYFVDSFAEISPIAGL